MFNGTTFGLNDATWSSHFWLPMSGSITRILSFRYAVVDIDLGEIFLNFPIHKQLHKSVGIDLTPFRKELIQAGVCQNTCSGEIIAARWTRLCLGLNQSPEHSVIFYYLAEEFIKIII